MAEKREGQLKEITKRLEQGLKELFTSEKYTEYLKTMSQFHNYSFYNTMLIAMQKPDATLVAGYSAWNKKFNRQVKRGEKGIQIIAPVPVRKKWEIEKFNPETNEPILRPDGQPEMEEVEHVIPRFRVATVFDISQTDGEPLPELDTPELTGRVENFPMFMEAVRMVSPVPMQYAEIVGGANGYYSSAEKRIVVREGMGEMQTMKTAVHEVAHAMCHDRDVMEETGEKKDQMTREVEAESVAFTVCSFFGMDTSSYSFPYIAFWSGNMEMKAVRSSLEFIRKTAGLLIDGITENIQNLQKEKEAVRDLREDDLVFQVALLSEEARRFYLVDNVGQIDLLRLLYTFAEQKGEKERPEPFLKEHGVHLDLWREIEHPEKEEDMPGFYDVLYMDREHIVDASRFSTLIKLEHIIGRAEYGHTALGREAHNMAVRHAYKLDDLDKTKRFVVDMVHAAENPETGNMQEIMEAAQAEIDALPDSKVGMLQMHEFGFRKDSVLPLTMERAVALHHVGFPVYNLHKDGSFLPMHTESEIVGAEGMFGVDKAAWENHLAAQSVQEEKQEERTAQKKMTMQEEIRKEEVQDLENKTYLPLYTHSFSYAMDHGETDDYHASGKLNWDCKMAVQDAIQEKYDGKHLAHDAADSVLAEYGAERVTFILANTVQHLEHDGRFSKDTKEWAKSFETPGNIEHGRDMNAKYIVTSHPAVLDGFIGLARKNMQEQEITHEAVLEDGQASIEPSITFYAAEYALTPVLGEYHEGLKTVQEAMDIYDKLPEGPKFLKGIGFCLEDGSDYAGRCELMTAGRSQKEFINDIPHYRESPLVQKAIADMEAIFAEREEQNRQNPEKETESPQPVVAHTNPVTPHQSEEKSAPIPEADQAGAEKVEKDQTGTDKPETDKTETAVHKSEPAGNVGQADKNPTVQESGGDKGQIEKKAAVPEKMAEAAPKTNRDASGVSRKQSVLNALRERQARLKAQEKQGQEEKKSRVHRKGGLEL